MLTYTAVTDADLPVVQDLAHRIWHAHYPALISIEQIDYMLERFFARDVLRQDLMGGVIWELARLDGQPVGFLSCVPEPPARRLKLSKLYLLPECHGRGLGRHMLDRVKDHARSRSATTIHLTVNKGNSRAIRAYERAGFDRTGEVVAEIGNGFVMDDYVMELSLTTTAVP